MESKFTDKGLLSRYSLDVNLFSKYDFLVEDVIPLRKVFILVTDRGNKILKKTFCSEDELVFMYEAINYLRKNGFSKIMNLILNKSGHIYTRWGEDTYIVMDLLEGREADYNNPVDITITADSLSEMHKASKGIKVSKNSPRLGGYRLLGEFRDKLKSMEEMYDIIGRCENKSEFQEVFLKNFEAYRDDMIKSLSILKIHDYEDLCRDTDSYVLCHNDLAYHNILIRNNEGWFIDLDYSIVDIRVRDICNFINKAAKYSCYNFDNVKMIMKEYQKQEPLTEKELRVLYGLLYFPEGFYSLIDSYFYQKKLWEYDSFMYKINKKVEDIDERHEMLDSFRTEYLSAAF